MSGSMSWRAGLRSSVAILVFGALASVSSHASADGKKPDCPTASEEGQRLRDRGKYLDAREMFRSCSEATCPAIVRKDCSKWLAEIDESVPSIVVAAHDAAGGDAVAVRVFVDGELLTSKLDGKPLSVDPGEHVMRFEMDGQPAVTESVVIRVGEKNRLLRVQVGAAPKEHSPVPVAPPPSNEAAPSPAKGSPPVLAYVLGGVGLLAVGGFVFFGVTGKKDLDDLRSTCAPYCDQSALDAVKSRMLVADVLLGVGVVSLSIATVLLLTRDTTPASARTTPSIRLDGRPLAGGGAAVVTGSF